MEKFNIGDIVYVSKYDYDNGSKGSNHLFVIIDKELFVPDEYFGFIISSKVQKSKTKSKYAYNEYIFKDKKNRLNKYSIVKCDQLFSFKEKYIQFSIEQVNVKDFYRFIKLYENYLTNLEKSKGVHQ